MAFIISKIPYLAINTFCRKNFSTHFIIYQKLIIPREDNIQLKETQLVLKDKVNNINSDFEPYFKRKIGEVYTIYEKLSGMDEVRMAQDKVIIIQEQLKDAQNQRREFIQDLSLIRKELQTLHTEILNCGRGENRYLELVKREIDLTQAEKDKLELFQLADTQERELFSYLTSAVRFSHEKERAQANTVKYWSIIGSVLGALLGIIASALSYRYRNTQIAEIKQYSRDAIDEINILSKQIEELNIIIRDSLTPKIIAEQKIVESWSSYLRRKTVGLYRYFLPKR